jgi:signal transduction histidine kinase
MAPWQGLQGSPDLGRTDVPNSGPGASSGPGPQASARPAERPGRLESLARRWRGLASGGPLRRDTGDSMAGGLAAMLAARTGIDVTVVRIVLVVLTLVSYGTFAVVYVACWLLIPAAGGQTSIGSKALTDKRGIALAAGLASALAIVLVMASALNATWLTAPGYPLLICAAGIVLIWRNAPGSEQDNLRRLADPLVGRAGAGRKSHPVLRVLLALALLVGGLTLALQGHHSYELLRPLGGVSLVILGVAVGLGPWWMRIARDLVAERQGRIRAEERADMASRVHDSVLQTLALIQRRATDPQQVVKLARAQERELRSWLFDGVAPGAMEGTADTLAAGVRLIQQEVEAQHGITVEAVMVGDCELDEDLRALLAAAREATVNAAKWSGAESASVFAEVEPETVTVFVRDRGRGFDPDAVPGDRKGLAESVHGRMARRGGSARVRSAPGEGTEVSLTMPRHAEERSQRRS